MRWRVLRRKTRQPVHAITLAMWTCGSIEVWSRSLSCPAVSERRVANLSYLTLSAPPLRADASSTKSPSVSARLLAGACLHAWACVADPFALPPCTAAVLSLSPHACPMPHGRTRAAAAQSRAGTTHQARVAKRAARWETPGHYGLVAWVACMQSSCVGEHTAARVSSGPCGMAGYSSPDLDLAARRTAPLCRGAFCGAEGVWDVRRLAASRRVPPAAFAAHFQKHGAMPSALNCAEAAAAG